MGDKTRGLFNKFYVNRTDGSDQLGGKHHGCEYFVLDLTHDKHAMAALLAYAESCQDEYPLLANDLMDKVNIRKFKECSCSNIGDCDGSCAPYCGGGGPGLIEDN